ncbi:helix-turn-helix domain-containing protein [Nocardioides speluncae]|uniref:helix-turn-helix domain-containing protein n=1 Tax=Nocardioides speluncae TaxID=2670337 RepID=UPI000D68E3F1|nr:helix-turn-helix transcriptional regulator [Nocardioides speluncae]
MSEFGSALRTARARRGLSLSELGRATTYDRSAVANIEAGRRTPDRRFAEDADTYLDAAGEVVAAWDRDTAERDARLEQRRLERLANAESLALAADTADVDGIGEQAASLAVAYLAETPSVMLREAATARHAALALLSRGGLSAESYADLLLATGRMSGVLAYAALDLGQPDQALQHTEAAWRCAVLAGDDELRAWVRGTQSLITRFTEDFPRALAYAIDGQQYVHGGPALARLLCGQAQTMAGLGASASVAAVLNDAERAREVPGPDGAGIFAFRETKQRYYAGSSLVFGEESKEWHLAEREAVAAVLDWETGPVVDRSLSDEALCRVYAATARVQLGELEGTRDALAPILDLPEDRRISWIKKRMGRIVTILDEPPYNGSPQAKNLRAELSAY